MNLSRNHDISTTMETVHKKISPVAGGGVLLIFNTLLFVILFLILPGKFEENDDIMMCMIANGTMTGVPDFHLVFINAVYGLILQYLYSTISGLEWYTILFSIFHIASISVITFQILTDEEWKPIFKISFLAFLYVIWARIIVAFQFTTTAGLLCFAGCLLMLKYNGKGKNYWISLCLSYLFIITASLIRFKAAGLVALIFAPLFINKCFRDKSFIVILATVVIPVILLEAADSCFYKDEWAAYKEYNTTRGFINDNPNALKILDELPDNISDNNYIELLKFNADPSIIGLPELKEIENLIQSVSTDLQISNIKNLTPYRIPLVLLAFLLLLAILFVPDKRKLSIPFIILLGILFLGISMRANLKNRVFLIMLLPSIYIACDFLKYMRKKQAYIFIIGTLLLVSSKYLLQTYKAVGTSKGKIELFQTHNVLISKVDGPVYIYGSDYPWEAINPFHVKDNQTVYPICTGWLTNFPSQRVPFRKYTDLIGPPVFSIISREQKSALPELIEANYSIKVEEKVIDSNEEYKLISLVNY